LGANLQLPTLTCIRESDEWERAYGTHWRQRARESLPGWQKTMGSELVLDIQALIAIVLDTRHDGFALLKFPRARTLLFDLREIRNIRSSEGCGS
jgi:hypothetical protein